MPEAPPELTLSSTVSRTGTWSLPPLSKDGKGTYAKDLLRRLIWLYVQGSVVAIAVCFLLFLLGLEFTLRQWTMFLVAIPAGMALYVVPDIYLIIRNYRRIGIALEKMDRGVVPAPEEVSDAIVRALNLPMYAFTRITFLHGPGAALAGMIIMFGGNAFLEADFMRWQIWTLFTIVLFFASPTHGIFEFFSVSRAMVPALERLSALPGGDISTDEQRARLKSTSLKRKLLYLALFVTALPLLFFASSILLKVYQLVQRLGVVPPPGMMSNLWWWIGGVVVVCMTGTVLMALLTAGEVSRSAAKLLRGMNRVERGDHGITLQITSTDEYADLYRGFNLMTEGLREEAKILGLSQDLMGELQLDPLLERIMRASTELLDAERSTLFIYDRKTNTLWSRFAEGLGHKEIRFPADRGIAGNVFTTGHAENIKDPYCDPRFNPEIDRKTGFRTRNILAVPVMNKNGQPIGVAQVLNKRGGSFTRQDEARLRAFSSQAAICLENARLFDEVRKIRDYNESILRSTSNGIMAFDESGALTSANPAAITLFGQGSVDLGMLLGQSAEDIFGQQNSWVLMALRTVAETGDVESSRDSDLTCPNGVVVSVNLTAAPLREANATVVGTLLIFEDLSAEKRTLDTMARYMDKEIVDQVMKSGGALEGSEQEVTMLFSDIRGFTSISEAIGARETVSMLNEYFTDQFDVIKRNGGILDKYIGDAIMALFGAPFARSGDADRAVQAAVDMVHSLRGFNERRAAAGKTTIEIGVGLNTGQAILGSIGSPKQMGYTAIGDSVNLASRLEAATRLYGVDILMSESTLHSLTAPVPVREIDRLRVKGKTEPVSIFEVLAQHSVDLRTNFSAGHEAYASGLRHYRRGNFGQALRDFDSARQLLPGDAASNLQHSRCLHFLAHPPGDDWDGVWTLKEK